MQCSLELEESDLVSLLSETSSADHQLVLPNETLLVGADSAVASVLSVLSLM